MMKYLIRIEVYIWFCFLQCLFRVNLSCYLKRVSCINYGCCVYLIKYINLGCIVIVRCKFIIILKDIIREKYGEENKIKL